MSFASIFIDSSEKAQIRQSVRKRTFWLLFASFAVADLLAPKRPILTTRFFVIISHSTQFEASQEKVKECLNTLITEYMKLAE